MEQSSKKIFRGEFSRTHSVRLPTPPPDPNKNAKSADNTERSSEANSVSKALSDKENEFLDYLNSLPLPGKYQAGEKATFQRVGSVFAPAMAAEDAFDHLDKLYKLMEQLLNLREQNAKLQRRVRDLEHFRNLQNLQSQVSTSVLTAEEKEVPELDDDSIFAEAFLDGMFTPGRNKRTLKHKSPTQFKFRQSLLRSQRDRSCSLAADNLTKANVMEQEKRTCIPRNCSGKSLPESAMLRKPSKVSKWTRVKAAFKWEKAAPTVSGAKSQDSGIGGMLPVNNEVARYLRVPSTCDNRTESGASPADSVLSGSWQGVHGLSTPGTLSPASSTDELNASTHSEQRSASRMDSAGTSTASGKRPTISRTSDEEDGDRRSHSLDYSTSIPCDSANSTISKEELTKLQASKTHKTPWGKVKDIIQIRKDSLKKKQYRLSSRSDDCRTDCSAGSDQEDVFEPAQPSSTTTDETRPAPTVTVTSSESNSYAKEKPTSSQSVVNSDDSHKIPADVLARYQRAAAEEDKCQTKPNAESPRVQRRVSKWTRVKKAFLPSASFSKTEDEVISQPASPAKHFQFFTEHYMTNPRENEFQDKLSYRKKLKDDPETRELKEEIYRNYEELQKKLSQEFQEKLQEWEKVKTTCGNPSSLTFSAQNSIAGYTSEESRNPEFARKLEEWEKIRYQNNTEYSRRRNIQMTSEENLPADFRKKLQEWQKIKKLGTKDEDVVASSRKKKSEWQLWRSNSKQENNPPESRQYSEEFLKKLDEWKQIKSSHLTNEEQEHKKLTKENVTTSPGLARKSSTNKLLRQSKKHKMQEWLEKELQKIEREKQRLEREKEKFLEREERLAKLRGSIGTGPNKKDVLVQTSTGFYRFEGISRKFTQRLYEWEKARGIGPEDSTFALLSSGYKEMFPRPARTFNANSYRHEKMAGTKLTRSKSMDSVANLTCDGSLMTHQPSSLSLNDMDDLEMRCLAETPSDQNLNESEDNLDFPEEPEAVIVEVEDFIEETAAPLEYLEENQHTPVYHTQVLNLCESEECEAPNVRRNASSRALSNYKLIQESLDILSKIRANEGTCKTTEGKLSETINISREKERQLDTCRSMGAIPKRKRTVSQSEQQNIVLLQDCLNNYYIQQSEICQGLIIKIMLLQDANAAITKNTCIENSGYTISHFTDTINLMQNVSTELVPIAEKLKHTFQERQSEFVSFQNKLVESSNKKYGQDINHLVTTLIIKIKELKRCLSYICAASDITTVGRKKKGSYKERKHSLHKRASQEKTPTESNEKKSQDGNTSDEEDYNNEKIKSVRKRDKVVKNKSEDNQLINHAKVEVTPISAQIVDNSKLLASENERVLEQNNTQKQQIKEDDADFSLDKLDTEALQNNCIQKKMLQSGTISETDNGANKDDESEVIESEGIQTQLKIYNFEQAVNVIIPTSIHYLDGTSDNGDMSNTNSPVSVFVQTTRKIFTPFVSDALDAKLDDSNSCTPKYIIQEKTENITDPQILNKTNIISTEKINDDALSNNLNTNKFEENFNQIDENCVGDNQNCRSTTSSQLPPLPNSPVTQRRDRHLIKETSPAIRMMIARYNQKLFEQESSGPKSGGSSGSASPVAWRSPVLERRVKAQTEKYEEEVNKTFMNNRYSPHFVRKQVQKSASIGVINCIKKQFTVPQITERDISLNSSDKNISPKLIRGILKSTSMDCMKTNQIRNTNEIQEPLEQTLSIGTNSKLMGKASQLKLSILSPQESIETSPVFQERAHKLQKAKEEFLLQNIDTPTPTSESLSASIATNETQNDSMNYPTRNRLSQASVGSESSCDEMKQSALLVRSVSAGMINVDEATYQQFRPEMHSLGYVSLPRSTKKKDGKFGISSLTSKFRRVKMRRCKNPSQMNTISTLCRQSLIVDITENEENETKNVKNTGNQDRSLDTQQASTSKSSWIKNPSKLFKPK